MGNVTGSNIFNTLLILGLSAAIRPIALTPQNTFRDIPFGIIASIILFAVVWSGAISRVEGVVMIVLYLLIMLYTVKKVDPHVRNVNI